MRQIKRSWKISFTVICFFSIIGFYFIIIYHGWDFIGICTIGLLLVPIVTVAGMTMEPQQNATLYTYKKDTSKWFNQGELLSKTPMRDNKKLSEVQEEHKQFMAVILSNIWPFIKLCFWIYVICLVLFYFFVGWGTFIIRLFI